MQTPWQIPHPPGDPKMHECSHGGQKAHAHKLRGKSLTPATDPKMHESPHSWPKAHVRK